jgi:hypothetical protein
VNRRISYYERYKGSKYLLKSGLRSTGAWDIASFDVVKSLEDPFLSSSHLNSASL